MLPCAYPPRPLYAKRWKVDHTLWNPTPNPNPNPDQVDDILWNPSPNPNPNPDQVDDILWNPSPNPNPNPDQVDDILYPPHEDIRGRVDPSTGFSADLKYLPGEKALLKGDGAAKHPQPHVD